MLRYYQYLFLYTSKKRRVWISMSVIWFFYFLFLFVVPKLIGISPMYLWNNQFTNVNLTTMIAISAAFSIIAIATFKEPMQDGSELVIFSKKITREKIITGKFFVFNSYILINIFVSLILSLLTLSFGFYHPIANPSGIKYNEFTNLIYSMCIANLIIGMIFGSIAILLTLFFNRTAVLGFTIAFAVFLNLVSNILPIIVTTPNNVLKSKYNIEIQNVNLYNLVDHDHVHAMTNTYPYYDLDLDNNEIHTTNYWTEKAQNEALRWVTNYIDLGSQVTSLYNFLDNERLDNAYSGRFGINARYHWKAQKADQIFDRKKHENIKRETIKPIIYVSEVNQGDNLTTYNILGNNAKAFLIFQAIGAKADSMVYVRSKNNLNENLFYDLKDLEFHVDWNNFNDLAKEKINQIVLKLKNKVINASNYEKLSYSEITALLENDEILNKIMGLHLNDLALADWKFNYTKTNLAYAKILFHLVKEMGEWFYQSPLQVEPNTVVINEKTPLINVLYQDTTAEYQKWIIEKVDEKFIYKDRFLYEKKFIFNHDESRKKFKKFNLMMRDLFNGFQVKPLMTNLVDGSYKIQFKTDVDETDYVRLMNNEIKDLISETNGNDLNNGDYISPLMNLTKFNIEEYNKKESVVLFWSMLSLMLAFATIITYFRIDIK